MAMILDEAKKIADLVCGSIDPRVIRGFAAGANEAFPDFIWEFNESYENEADKTHWMWLAVTEKSDETP